MVSPQSGRGIRSGVGARCRVPVGIPGTPWTPQSLTFGNGVPAIRVGHSFRRRGTLRACGGFRGHHGHHCSRRLGMVSPQSGRGALAGGTCAAPASPRLDLRARSSVPLREIMMAVSVCPCQSVSSVSVRVPVTGRHQHAGRYPIRRRGTLLRAPTVRHTDRRCACVLARVRPCLCNWAASERGTSDPA